MNLPIEFLASNLHLLVITHNPTAPLAAIQRLIPVKLPSFAKIPKCSQFTLIFPPREISVRLGGCIEKVYQVIVILSVLFIGERLLLERQSRKGESES